MARRDTLSVVLIGISGLLLAAAVFFTFTVPTAQRETGGDVQRIFYFHVGIAWVAGLALLVTFAASILYLARGEQRQHDIIAHASVEIGVVFGVMVIASGMLWARPVWNTWWTWDPRLTTTAISLFIYVAYLMLRGAIDDPQRRARFAARTRTFVVLVRRLIEASFLASCHRNLPNSSHQIPPKNLPFPSFPKRG